MPREPARLQIALSRTRCCARGGSAAGLRTVRVVVASALHQDWQREAYVFPHGEQVSHQADLAGHEGPVWQVSWGHPKFGGILASCSFDHRVIIWKELAEGSWQQARAPSRTWRLLLAVRSFWCRCASDRHG